MKKNKEYINKLICPHCGKDNFDEFAEWGTSGGCDCPWCYNPVYFECEYHITVLVQESLDDAKGENRHEYTPTNHQ